MAEEAAGGGADDLQADPAGGQRLLLGAALRGDQFAAQRLEALLETAAVEAQAAQHVDHAAGAGQAAAETDAAQAPAAAEPEEGCLAVFLEGLAAQQCRRDGRTEQAFEDGGDAFLALIAVDGAG